MKSKSKEEGTEAGGRASAADAPTGDATPADGGITITKEVTGRDSVQQRLKELAAKRRAELERRAAQRRAGGVEPGAGPAGGSAGPVVAGGTSAIDQRQEQARRRAEEVRRRREAEQIAARQRTEREKAERERIARQRRAEEGRQSKRGAAPSPAGRYAGTRAAGVAASPPPPLDERHLTVVESAGAKRGAGPVWNAAAGPTTIAALLQHRDGVRSAIILGELLGPPVALRDDDRPMI
jgi:hypothetical protein